MRSSSAKPVILECAGLTALCVRRLDAEPVASWLCVLFVRMAKAAASRMQGLGSGSGLSARTARGKAARSSSHARKSGVKPPHSKATTRRAGFRSAAAGRPAPARGHRSDASPRRRSGSPRGLCRRSAQRRRERASRIAISMALARSSSTLNLARFWMPA